MPEICAHFRCVEGDVVKRIRQMRLCLSLSLASVLASIILGFTSIAQAKDDPIRIVSPRRGETVSGPIQIKLKAGSETRKVDIYIDGRYLRSGPPYIARWRSTEVGDGEHRITAVAFGRFAVSSVVGSTFIEPVQVLASESESIKVRNHRSTPTPPATPTPTPIPATPTPDPPTPTPLPTPGPQVNYHISTADSVMLQCHGQLTRNGTIYLSSGENSTYACSSPGLPDHGAVLVKCNGGNPNGNSAWLSVTLGQSAKLSCTGGATPTATPMGTPTPIRPTPAPGTPTPLPRPTPTVTPGHSPSPTPSSSPTPSPLPSGIPTPPAIPSIPTLKSPITIRPGANFSGYTVYGDGVTDDTPAIQAALNTRDVIVAPATYAVAGNVTLPTGRNISCQSGAIFLDTQSQATRMFQIGFDSSSIGNNSIVGCILEGTDTASNYSTYTGGIGGYSELLEIASGWGLHTDNVLVENNTFLNGQGDNIITYSPCGTANTGAPCNNGAPGTEGPSHIFIVNNTISHCGQPGIHFNGGQLLVATGNTVTDCNADDEVDSNVLQVITAWWSNNTFTTTDGTFDALSNTIVGPMHTCTGDTLIPENDKGCYSYNNNINGAGLAGPSVLAEPSGCAGGGGHYINNSLTSGAVLSSGC